MKVNRYAVSADIVVESSPERAYAIATATDLVPVYETDVSRIEVIEETRAHERLVRSTLRILGFDTDFIYRYRYSPGRHYSGVQEGGRLVRGYFSFSFERVTGGTRITHREGVFSRTPLAAKIVGWLYFRAFSRGSIKAELAKLETLILQTHEDAR